MKRKNALKRILIKNDKFILIFFLALFLFAHWYGELKSIFDPTLTDRTTASLKADGFSISSYDIELNVNKNNQIDVVENVTVFFTKTSLHGIYRDIPLWSNYTSKDGKIMKRRVNIINYLAIADQYVLSNKNGNKRITIGDEKEKVSFGNKTYTISYTYDMGNDPYKGFDELIFHAYGDSWGTEIKNATLTINMPTDVDGYNINFFFDKYRKESANKYIDYVITENTIIVKYIGNESEDLHNKVPLKKSLTIDIELPDGYFTNTTSNYGTLSLILIVLSVGLTIFNFIIWLKNGKNFKSLSKKPEFFPPNNYDASEVGYIYSGQYNEKLIVSLIIQLASKKYITINELADKTIKITNLLVKPKSIKDYVQKRIITIAGLKQADQKILDKKEMKIMNQYFSDNYKCTINIQEGIDDVEEFIKVKDSLVEKGFITIISDNDDYRFDVFSTKSAEYKKYYYEYDGLVNQYNTSLSKLPPISKNESKIYDWFFGQNHAKNEVILDKEESNFAISIIQKNLTEHLNNKINENSKKIILKSRIITILTSLCHIISYHFVKDLNPGLNIFYVVSFICIFINAYFVLIMKRKTKYGEEQLSRIKEFRKFLINADELQLKLILNDNPNYFYEMLPYAYVLNVFRKWIKKFNNIDIPPYYIGDFKFNSTRDFRKFLSHMYFSYNSACSTGSLGGISSSSGSGGSSGGGGGSW